MSTHWHFLTAEKVFLTVDSSESGLSEVEVKKRLKVYGPNSLPSEKPRSVFSLFISQFESPLIYILLISSVIVLFMGEIVDSLIIMFVLLFNAVIGVFQEGRAQNTLMALKQYVKTNATVVRGGEEFVVPDYEVVPGDILILQEGDRIPADARIISSQNLKLDEASFTGESEPVHKVLEVMEGKDLPASEQKNMVFMGTHVVSGNGRAVVVGTGLSTVIGGIAKQISSIDTEVPLKANIRQLSKIIIYVMVVINVILFTVGIMTGYSVKEMFIVIVSISVSAIPEGLPIVITLVLATGVWRMSKRNALVKRLQAVEALGQAKVIAVDKTGTITKNELVVRRVWINGDLFEVEGEGYEPKGAVKLHGRQINTGDQAEFLFLAKMAGLGSSARLFYVEDKKTWRIAGDPTEAAMLVLSEKVGFKKEELIKESPLVSEIPFDYKLKYHATVNLLEGKRVMIVAGAPEAILSLSTKTRQNGNDDHLSEEEKERLEGIFSNLSEEGFRTIAIAVRTEAPEEVDQNAVSSLSFVGFVGMQDTIRQEAPLAVKDANNAGIRVVMITGDHKITGTAIARAAGIYHDGDTVLTGADVDNMTSDELKEKLSNTTVFARVTPEHKKKIIDIYKQRGEVIAMTGDGVNDAPSLVAADLGVAMGKIGTEVAKEASDIILLDDNFGSIVAAVEEGRNIYQTIKKVILFLFSTSLGEIFTIAVALFTGLPLPLMASQIIWLNFVTDGFLVAPLALEPKGKKLMSGWKQMNKYFVDRMMVGRGLLMSISMVAGTIMLFCYYLNFDTEKALTISLTSLAVFQWFNAWNCRSEGKSIFNKNWFSNKFLVVATALAILAQLAAIYVPFMQKILQTVPLNSFDWYLVLSVGSSIIIVEEIRKIFYQRKHRADKVVELASV
jgi:Ca2+-transporting ATPase